MSGLAPLFIGVVAVLLVPPILGFALNFAAAGAFGPVSPTTQTIQMLGLSLIGSPLLSWAALIVAAPLSAYAARKGLAGWGVAALCGLIVGLVVDPVLNGVKMWSTATILSLATGLTLALIYWIAVRLSSPAALGVTAKGP